MHTPTIVTSRVAKLAVGVLALLGGAVATSSPALAATSVSFCGAGAYREVQLVTINSSGDPVAVERPGRANASGCGTFYNTPTDRRLAVTFSTKSGTRLYRHQTVWHALPGYGAVNLGSQYRTTLICSQCSAD